jgi:hypothetical protein
LNGYRAVQSSRNFLLDGSLHIYLHLHACSQHLLHAGHSTLEPGQVFSQHMDGVTLLSNILVSAIIEENYLSFLDDTRTSEE